MAIRRVNGIKSMKIGQNEVSVLGNTCTVRIDNSTREVLQDHSGDVVAFTVAYQPAQITATLIRTRLYNPVEIAAQFASGPDAVPIVVSVQTYSGTVFTLHDSIMGDFGAYSLEDGTFEVDFMGNMEVTGNEIDISAPEYRGDPNS